MIGSSKFEVVVAGLRCVQVCECRLGLGLVLGLAKRLMERVL